MSLRVIKTGLSDTFQDEGRFGFGHLGINPAGAMDPLALALSNALVGNSPGDAVLEMHFPAPVLRFESAALFALSGAEFGPMLDGSPIPVHAPVQVVKGGILTFRRPAWGARCYLAVQGGFQLAPWLGSFSTHRTARAGGWKGRALREGDLVPLRTLLPAASVPENKVLPWSVNCRLLYPAQPAIRFLPGVEYEWLEPDGVNRMVSERWTITRHADRMGYRLEGPALALQKPVELISSGVVRGTIQLLPGGSLIVLMADCQTTGGYPRIGHVISADLPALAQLASGQSFYLQKTDPQQAFDAFHKQQSLLRRMRRSCIFRLQEAGLIQ